MIVEAGQLYRPMFFRYWWSLRNVPSPRIMRVIGIDVDISGRPIQAWLLAEHKIYGSRAYVAEIKASGRIKGFRLVTKT
jgi:hypothetical protein